MHGTQEASGPPSKGPVPHDVHRDHERPSSVASKRHREWDDEPHPKKHANDENRARMDDHRHRRPSTPSTRDVYQRSPEIQRYQEQHRQVEEQRRAEESRRAEEPRRQEEAARHANDNYHPSEAAHHPPAHSLPAQLPPMQGPAHDSPIQQNTATKDFQPKEERPRAEHPAPPAAPAQPNEPERAARKMDVDEDYDDSGEDDKKLASAPAPSAAGPPSNGNVVGPDVKSSTPSNAGANGFSGPAPKTESVS